jgi:peptidoglycan/LPS O-acetylase OafA/YrhL
MNVIARFIKLLIMYPVRDLFSPPKGQVAALDFLRSCAILMVAAFHFTRDAYLPFGGIENAVSRLPFVRYGWAGVDLFFVLSGYLIGRQLWREMDRTGTVRVTRFVLRRGFRIWPLYFAVFAFGVVAVGRSGSPPLNWWANLTFLSNYFPHLDMVPGSWSLCVEEQFYILVPLLLLLGAAAGLPVRHFRWVLLVLLTLLPAVRAATCLWYTNHGVLLEGVILINALVKPIHTHSDGLVVGLLLAHLDVLGGDRFKRGFLGTGWVVLIGLGMGLATYNSPVFVFFGCALFFGACAWFLIARRRPELRVLDSRVFYILSRLSFGMYLNHFYIHHSVARFTLRYVPGTESAPAAHLMVSIALFVACSAGIAAVTFCLIEWPFLRLRERLYGGHPTAPPSRQIGGLSLPLPVVLEKSHLTTDPVCVRHGPLVR